MADVRVGDYVLSDRNGVWFLLADDGDRIAGTLIPQPDGSWKCRTPAGPVRTVKPPAGVPDPAAWVARQVT